MWSLTNGSKGQDEDDASDSGEMITLKLGHTNAPGQPCATAVETMAKKLRKRQWQGSFDIYVNGAIGDEEELVESAIMGTVDMALFQVPH